MKNQDIRQETQAAGLKLWQIAEGLGITDATLSRKLRREFTPEQKKQVRQIIDQLKGETAHV